MCGCLLSVPYWGPGLQPTLTGNRTCNPLIRRPKLNPLTHTSQGELFMFLEIGLQCYECPSQDCFPCVPQIFGCCILIFICFKVLLLSSLISLLIHSFLKTCYLAFMFCVFFGFLLVIDFQFCIIIVSVMLDMISIFLNLLRLVLCPNVVYPRKCALEKFV